MAVIFHPQNNTAHLENKPIRRATLWARASWPCFLAAQSSSHLPPLSCLTVTLPSVPLLSKRHFLSLVGDPRIFAYRLEDGSRDVISLLSLPCAVPWSSPQSLLKITFLSTLPFRSLRFTFSSHLPKQSSISSLRHDVPANDHQR